MQCATLRDLIRVAYDTFANGPRQRPDAFLSWEDELAGFERFDIEASASAAPRSYRWQDRCCRYSSKTD